MPKAPPGYSKAEVTELAEILGFDLKDLKSTVCTENRHEHCLGTTVLLRPYPRTPAAWQPFPCLCSCHEIFTLAGAGASS